MIRYDLRTVIDIQSYLEAAPENTRKAASMAINDVIGGEGLARYRRAISDQINFPAGYLNDQRFGMHTRASPSNLVATLVARQQPTSLARFAQGGTVGGKGGVSVQVKRGGATKTFKSGFLVRLKAGSALGGNIGLAVRLAPGQQLNKRDTSNMVHLESNVVLLYGPSIDQVLNTSVAEAETPEVLNATATEFYRQFARLQGDA